MGKKHVTQENQEETLKESEKIESALKKEVKVKTSQRVLKGKV